MLCYQIILLWVLHLDSARCFQEFQFQTPTFCLKFFMPFFRTRQNLLVPFNFWLFCESFMNLTSWPAMINFGSLPQVYFNKLFCSCDYGGFNSMESIIFMNASLRFYMVLSLKETYMYVYHIVEGTQPPLLWWFLYLWVIICF